MYYIRLEDITPGVLHPSDGHSFCEWKGQASYYDLVIADDVRPNVGWYYRKPSSSFADIANCVAFYPSRVDACFINDERVEAQEGDFYGGWITSRIVGPFKGGAGTRGW